MGIFLKVKPIVNLKFLPKATLQLIFVLKSYLNRLCAVFIEAAPSVAMCNKKKHLKHFILYGIKYRLFLLLGSILRVRQQTVSKTSKHVLLEAIYHIVFVGQKSLKRQLKNAKGAVL